MKFLFFCILFLGIFSCNIPKNNAPKADTEYQTKSPSNSNRNKDSLHIELRQCRFSQRDSTVILYSIKNQTQWHYIYLSDKYWIERQVNGKQIRIQNDFGSILMGKEIPVYSCMNGYAKVFLKEGNYKFCNTAYSGDTRIDSKRIVIKTYFEVKFHKHSNQDISHFRTNDLFCIAKNIMVTVMVSNIKSTPCFFIIVRQSLRHWLRNFPLPTKEFFDSMTNQLSVRYAPTPVEK